MTAVRRSFDSYWLDWASSRTARRWRAPSLLDRGVPLGQMAGVGGHAQIPVTLRHVGRGRGTDEQVRAALQLI